MADTSLGEEATSSSPAQRTPPSPIQALHASTSSTSNSLDNKIDAITMSCSVAAAPPPTAIYGIGSSSTSTSAHSFSIAPGPVINGYELPPLFQDRPSAFRSHPALPSLLNSVNMDSPTTLASSNVVVGGQQARGSVVGPMERMIGPSRGSERQSPASSSQHLPVSPRQHPYLNHRPSTTLGSILSPSLSPPSTGPMPLTHRSPQELADEGWESEPFKCQVSNKIPTRTGVATELMSPSGPMMSMMPYRRLSGKVNTPSACATCKKAHLGCDTNRPCRRCSTIGKPELCMDVTPKKRGRPKTAKSLPEEISESSSIPSQPPPSHREHPHHHDEWSPKGFKQSSSSSDLFRHRSSSAEFQGQGHDGLSPTSVSKVPAKLPLPTLMERRLDQEDRSQIARSAIRGLSDFGVTYAVPQPPRVRPPMSAHGFGTSSAGSPVSPCTLFVSTSLDIFRCSSSTENAIGFSLAQLQSQSLLRFVHSDDINAMKRLRVSLIGNYSERGNQANGNFIEELRRRSESDLQAPASSTLYVDDNIRILTSTGEYCTFNVRMHIGGAFGADGPPELTFNHAYIVISLLRLDIGKELSTPETGGRASTSTGSQSAAPALDLRLPSFSTISAGITQGEYSPWHTMPHTPLLVRPLSSPSTASSPGIGPPSSSLNQTNWLGLMPGGSFRSPGILGISEIDLSSERQMGTASHRHLPVPAKPNSIPWPRSLQEGRLDVPMESYSLTSYNDASVSNLHRNHPGSPVANATRGNSSGFGSSVHDLELPQPRPPRSHFDEYRRDSSDHLQTGNSTHSVLEGWNPVENDYMG